MSERIVKNRPGFYRLRDDKQGNQPVGKGPKLSKQRCRVCSRRIPVVAAVQGDLWCSAVCCRREHGVEAA